MQLYYEANQVETGGDCKYISQTLNTKGNPIDDGLEIANKSDSIKYEYFV